MTEIKNTNKKPKSVLDLLLEIYMFLISLGVFAFLITIDTDVHSKFYEIWIINHLGIEVFGVLLFIGVVTIIIRNYELRKRLK